MHLTLKQEATKPPEYNLLQQQERFESFMSYYNEDRPHQAIGMKYPGELYTPSAKTFSNPEQPEYPYVDKTVLVTQCGRICVNGRKISLSRVFAGHYVGIKEIADEIWLVKFMDYELGFFDETADRVEPAADPFTLEKVLPMSSV